MKYRLFLIMATLAVLGNMTTSCSWDDVRVVAPDGDQKTPISFNVNIGSLPDPVVTTRSNNTLGGNASPTRGYTTGSAYNSGYTFVDDDLVSVGVTGDGSTSSRSTTEVVKQYTVDAGTGTQDLSYSNDADASTSDGFYWMNQSEELSLRAWSYGNSTTPATDPCASGNTFTIETSQNTQDANNKVQVKELLYSPAATYKYQDNNGAIEIPLYHQLARVVVTVVSDNTTIPVQAMSIGYGTDDKIPITGTFSAPSSGDNYGSWSVASKATQASHWGVVTPKQEAMGVYSAVLIPGTPTEYPADLRFINITLGTGDDAETFAYKLPTGGITLSPGKQYNYTISVKNQGIVVTSTITDWGTLVEESPQANLPIDIRRNPLWYVAEYNTTNPHNTTWLTMGSSDNEGYFYLWADAMRLFSTGNASGESTYYNGYKHVEGAPEGTTWHLPIQAEMWSIVPGHNQNIFGYVSDGSQTALREFSASEKVVWGYNSDTQTGIQEDSYFVWESSNSIYGIRFLGTPYCSIWKYAKSGAFTESDYGRITITSKMLRQEITKDNVASIYNTAEACASEFDGLTFVNGNDVANAAAQRVFYMHGVMIGSSSPTAATLQGNNGPHWTATEVDADNAWDLHFGNGYANIYDNCAKSSASMNVRLFRDSYTYSLPSKAKTTVEQILAGVSTDYEVGDVVCQDGSIFRYDGTNSITARKLAEMEGRSPIGIIVYKCAASPTETDYNVTEGMGHALVMGIDDIDPTGAVWCGNTSALGKDNETSALFPDNASVEDAIADFQGLLKTNTLISSTCVTGHSHPCFSLLNTWRNNSSHTPLFNSTQWFVASSGQWLASLSALLSSKGDSFTPVWDGTTGISNWTNISTIINNEAGGVVNSYTDTEMRYWSSSEGAHIGGFYRAFCIAFNNGVSLSCGHKEHTYRVRPFFAF